MESTLLSMQPGQASRAAARAIAVATALVGLVVMVGWILTQETLTSIGPGWINMKANTALCFILSAASLWILLLHSHTPARARVAQGLAGLVFLAGFLSLMEYVFALDLGIDQALFLDRMRVSATAFPGRMAVTAAVDFMLLGWALFFFRSRFGRLMQVPAVLAACIGVLGLAGYLYGADTLRQIGPQGIALPTTLTLMVFSTGVILGRPDAGVMRLITRREVGGILLRRLLPATVVVPFVLGWVIHAGEQRGLYSQQTAWALFALATAIALAVTVARSASIISRLDESLRERTAKLKAEQALKESTARYRTLFENMLDGYAYCRMIYEGGEPKDFVYLEVNSAFRAITGLSDVEGKTASAMMPGSRESNPRMFEVSARVARTGAPERLEVYLPRAGKFAFISVYSPAPDHFITIFENIDDRKRLEQSLEQQKSLLLAVIDSLPDLIFVKDLQGRFVLANKALARAAGVDDPRLLLGKTDYEISPKEIADLYVANDRAILESGRSQINTEELSTFGARSARWILTTKVPLFDSSGVVNGLVGISRDITERRELETNMQQTQKLESLGVLAGGIAHDFNNILTIILGNAEVAGLKVPSDSPAQKPVAEIKRASLRAADLCRQMLAYSGKGQFEIRPLDLSDVITEMMEMLHIGISRKARLHLALAEGLPAIEADVAQMRQVIMNLVMNASEAVGESSGDIVVSTSVVDCDQACMDTGWGGEPAAPGRYVALEVTDTGAGMDDATRARIFEPFFTTKFTGRGLGLSAVMGIVRSHRGAIRVTSTPGQGTAFKVMFPASTAPVQRLHLARPAPLPLEGSGTILVADDEEGVLHVARAALERLGFTVLSAQDGSEALEVYREHMQDIVCVMLDLTMPKMDGEEAFRRMRALNPNVKVLLCSGYGEQQAVRQFSGSGLPGFLQKPYLPETLAQKLREILGTRD